MGRTVYTLEVNGYPPAIVALTRPLLAAWTRKIGAELCVIRRRRWPTAPPVYEKLQIYDLARERRDDWSIFVDADALIHPDFFDPTELVGREVVFHHGADLAGNRWQYDDYFRRDGRHIGSCNWFTGASAWCRDLWRPLEDLTIAEATARIFPTVHERATVITADHLIDDYVLSRNIARFGLKFTTILELLARLGHQGDYLWHQYTLTTDQKIVEMKTILEKWGAHGNG